MAAEHQSKKTEKVQPAKPVVEPAGPEFESQPESFIAGSLREMPPGVGRKQILRQQKVAGNRYVQRVLLGSVIQRNPGPGEGGNTSPIPVLADMEARRSLALAILKKGFGGRIKSEAKVVEIKGTEGMWTEYDSAMIRQGKEFREPAEKKGEEGKLRPWQSGDAQQHPDLKKKGEFKGFNDPSTGQVYIDTSQPPDEQVATIVHEMLHANAAPDFPATLGKRVDEGVTEKLTRAAFTASGYAAPTGQYESEVGFATSLGQMIGEGALTSAYFGGVDILRDMMNVGADKKIFEDFAREARANNWDWMESFFNMYYEKMKGGSELQKKIASINYWLSGWVYDEDLANIEAIYRDSSPEDRAQLRAVIEPQIGSLIDIGQRTRLRVLLVS